MKEDQAIHNKLKRLETAARSMPPIVDGVMGHVRQMPTPIRRRFPSRQIAAVACTAAVACLVVAIGVWMVGDDHEPVHVASTSSGQSTPQNGEEDLGTLAARPFEHGRGEAEGTGEVDTDYGERVETVPVLPDWASPGERQYGRPPMSITVARSSAIARCTIVKMPEEGNEGFALCKVDRVIYGKLPEEQIRLYLSHARLGATRVFFLSAIPPEADAEVDYSINGCGPIDVGEVHELEQEVAEVVESGDHLTPPDLSGYHLGMYIRASTRIVRAKLRKVGTSAAEWKVLDELEFQPFSEADGRGMQIVDVTTGQGLHGGEPAEGTAEPRPTEPDIVRVGLAAWRLRAETVAGYRAAHEPIGELAMDGPEGGPVTGAEASVTGQADVHEFSGRPTEKEIQQACDRLVADELKVGTKAILLLRPAEEANTYNVVGNFFADPERPEHLDHAWKTIKRIVDSGEYKDTSIHY
jgi:hypothetical protein